MNTEAEPFQITINYLPIDEIVLKAGLFPKVELKEPSGYIEINNEKFTLKQFHFHSPSDHQLNDKSFPIAIHLVHQNEKGQLAVIGMFVQEGEGNDLLAPILNKLPNEGTIIELSMSLEKLFPNNLTHYVYEGSLTTPPCTEGVQWIVFEQPIVFSKEQIEAITKKYSPTNRPVQPLNNRSVIKQNTVKIK